MTPPHLILMLTSELFKTTSCPKHSNEPYHLQTPQKGATLENQSNLNKTLSQKLRFYNQTWPLAQGFMLCLFSFGLVGLVQFDLAWLLWFVGFSLRWSGEPCLVCGFSYRWCMWCVVGLWLFRLSIGLYLRQRGVFVVLGRVGSYSVELKIVSLFPLLVPRSWIYRGGCVEIRFRVGFEDLNLGCAHSG